MLIFLHYILTSIVFIVLGFLIGDIISFIYNGIRFYKKTNKGDIYIFHELPTRKYSVVISGKGKFHIYFQKMNPNGTYGEMTSLFAPLFYLSSEPVKL